MSQYTTEVRWICESKYDGEDPEDIDSVIADTYSNILKIKLAAEIFDPEYYPIIAQKIIRHYYFREIGAETVGLWIYWMNTRFSELLPYYNKLWQSALLEFDPFKDVDYTREGQRTGQTQQSQTEATETNKAEQHTEKDTNISGENRSADSNTVSSASSENKGTENANGLENNIGNETGSLEGDDTTTLTKTTDSDTTETDTTTNTKVTDQDTTGSSTEHRTGTVTTDDDRSTRDLFSDTPQNNLSPITAETYLTNARQITETDDNTVTNNLTNTLQTTGTMDETVTDTGRGTKTISGEGTEESTEEKSIDHTETKGFSNAKTTNDTKTSETTTKDDKVDTTKENATANAFSNGSRSGDTVGTTKGSAERQTEDTAQEHWIEKIAGKMNTISYSELLEKYRKTFLNIDLMFIKEFDDLFMRLW